MFALDTAGPLAQVMRDLNECIGKTSLNFPESAQLMTEGQRFLGVVALGMADTQPARLIFKGQRDADLGTINVTLTFSILPLPPAEHEIG